MMTREEAIERIQKLLALSQSPNEHEAKAAANMAQQIMSRYQIDMVSVSGGGSAKADTEVMHQTIFESGRIENWRTMLLSGIAKNNACVCTIGAGRGLFITGNRGNRQTVTYMFQMLCKIVENAAMNKRGFGRSYIASYKNSFVAALLDTMNSARKQAEQSARQEAGSSSAMVHIDRAVAIYNEELAASRAAIGKTSNYAYSSNRNRDGSRDGWNDGKSAQINASRGGLSSGAARLNG